MNTLPKYKAPSVALTAMLSVALVGLLASCGGSEQATASTTTEVNGDRYEGTEQPLGDMAEFDGYAIRANVSPTENLPDAMAQQYGIEAGPKLFLLNVVILETETETEQHPEPGSVEVSAYYEDLTGRNTSIDMRRVVANDRSSYIGILEISEQRVFEIVVEAQLENTVQPLRMSFEVQLDAE